MTDMFASPSQPRQQPGPGAVPIPGTPLADPYGAGPPPPVPQHAAQPPQEASAPAAVRWDTGYPTAGHELLAKHHNVHGALDLQLRRLGELAGAHAAVLSHIITRISSGDSGEIGQDGEPFWPRIVEAMKANHGGLRLIEQTAEELLVDHAAVIGAVERFL